MRAALERSVGFRSSGMRGAPGSNSGTLPLSASDVVVPSSGRWFRLRTVVIALALFVALVLLIRLGLGQSASLRSSGSPASAPRDVYHIAAVADLDQRSKDGSSFKSFLKRGRLLHQADGTFTVSWDSEAVLKSDMNEGGRGMELSDLVLFQGELLTCDDRTGIVFRILDDNTVAPRFILGGGDGTRAKGFKCEWLTVKDDELFAGSTGKEWTTPQGVLINHDPTWVKVIDRSGAVRSVEWSRQYSKLREVTGTQFPGYLIHEAVAWSPHDRRWYILPRRVSTEPYDDVADEQRGSNLVLVATEDFSAVGKFRVGPEEPSHGFSSVKFLPGRPDTMVALRSKEDAGTTASYITVFTTEGQVLLEETLFSDQKFEGVAVLDSAPSAR